MNNSYRLTFIRSLLTASVVLCTGSACFACDGDEKSKKNTVTEETSLKPERTVQDKNSNIKPMPSMTELTPAFQSSLTQMIRNKGHADSAKKKGDFKRAKKIYLKCIKDPKVNNRALGFCYKSLAEIYEKEGNAKESRKYYKLALEQMKKHKMKRQADALENILKQKTDG